MRRLAVGVALTLSLGSPGQLSAQGAAAACAAIGGGPDIAACAAPAGGMSEIQALNKLACILNAINRWKLAVVACSQGQIDEWQATVMWPATGLRSIGQSLQRVRTLRDEVHDMLASSWVLDPKGAALAAIYSAPVLVDRDTYEANWGRSVGPDHDLHDVAAWLSAFNRNTIQARTSAAFGLAGELPEETWERIGREGSRAISDDTRDPLSAIRLTPQMVADRLRVDTNTARLEAQTLLTGQVHRDYRRLKREREQHLGAALLDTLTGAARPGGER